jgi:hypothetical protein
MHPEKEMTLTFGVGLNTRSLWQAAKGCGCVVQALYKYKWLKICGDLATAVKHFKLTSRVSSTSQVPHRSDMA